MARPQPITVLDPLPWSRSTVTWFALSELVNGGQLVSNVDGQPAVWIVPSVTDREPNPPYGTLSASIVTTSAALPHRRAASCAGCATTTGWNCTTSPQHNFVGGHLRRRLRGISGDPSELGSLGPPLPCGAAHTRHARATGASCGMRRRPVDLAAGLAQGVLHPLHDDLQQHGVGAGMVLPPQ
jgi:hypothetical protein